jgi:hypothetical protein
MTCETKRGNWLDAGCQIRDQTADFYTRNFLKQGLDKDWLFIKKKLVTKFFMMCRDVERLALKNVFKILNKFV